MVAALDRAMGSSRPLTEPTRPIATPPADTGGPPATSGGRRGWPLLAGLAALVVAAVVGFVLLSDGDRGGSGDGERSANTPPQTEPSKKNTPTPTPTPTAERTAEPTATATAEPTSEAPAGPDLDRARQLQVQGFNARQAGDYEQALALNQQAIEACGDTVQLDPCGYALFEIGAALNALGRPDEAIAPLEQRLEQYGDNSGGEVKDELKKARKGGKGND
jgi:hypothetical protein